MVKQGILGSNYGWYVSSEHGYVDRGLNSDIHATIAIAAVSMDPKLMALKETLGHPVTLGVTVGRNTLHVRVYDHFAAIKRPDMLASRLAVLDTEKVAYLTFNQHGGLEVVEGHERVLIGGHAPLFHASRVLNPNTVSSLDGLQLQFTGRPVGRLGMPTPQSPVKTEEFVELFQSEPPTLE